MKAILANIEDIEKRIEEIDSKVNRLFGNDVEMETFRTRTLERLFNLEDDDREEKSNHSQRIEILEGRLDLFRSRDETVEQACDLLEVRIASLEAHNGLEYCEDCSCEGIAVAAFRDEKMKSLKAENERLKEERNLWQSKYNDVLADNKEAKSDVHELRGAIDVQGSALRKAMKDRDEWKVKFESNRKSYDWKMDSGTKIDGILGFKNTASWDETVRGVKELVKERDELKQRLAELVKIGQDALGGE